MAVSQDLPRDQRRVPQRSHSQHQVYAFGNMIHHAFSNEDLNAHVRMGCLECAHQRRKQGIGDAGRGGKPQNARHVGQVIRSNIVDRFAEFRAAQRMLEHL